jgi:hypothetical protein
LDFAFIPSPKASLRTKGGGDLNLGNLSVPLRLTGTLAQPTLGVSAGGTALAVEKMIGGELAGLAGLFTEAGEKDEQDFCLAAIERAKRGGKEPPAKKESEPGEKKTPEKKSPAGQAGDAFRKIFGR